MSPSDPLRVAVFGVGAVGGYFGGRLATAGHDVTFVARGETLTALESHGLRVDSIDEDFVVSPADAADEPAAVGPVDLVLLGVKAWQVATVASSLRPMVEAGGVVLPLQNGVEAVDQLVDALGTRHVLGGLCKIISFQVAPAHIRHAGATPYIALGELDDRPSERVERIRRAFDLPGMTVEVPASIRAAIWAKFLFIAAASGVGAATRATLGEIRDLPVTRDLLERSMGEIANVARAHGVALPDDILSSTMAFVDSLPASGTASMQRDIMDGLPSELDSQTGAVVRLGREAGVETPIHSTLYALLKPLERRARGAS